MFPPTDDFSQFSPLTYDIVLYEIFVPEVAVRLIQEDLHVSPEDAISILRESYSFGLTLHPSDDCPCYNFAARIIAPSHRNHNWSYKVYKESGTDVDFESWLQHQMSKEGVAATKVEPMDMEGSNFIDLTNDDV